MRIYHVLASSPLCLSGRCAIAEVPLQSDLIIAAVSDGAGSLIVDLSGIEQVDVTLVQLLVAARAGAASRNRPFAISSWSPAAEDTFLRAGLPVADFAPSSAIGA